MTELKFFRLMLVVLATLVLSLGSGWAYYTHRQHLTEAAIDSAFGEYNRYIAACGDNKEGGAWDLAQRAYDSVSKLSAARDVYAGRAELPLWIGAIVCPALVALFYALRWAMTGRVRPLWLLGRRSTAG
ncbi:MAG: hypothetical protein JF606_04940 [Burkholderiales bacterium]|jgi:hypothetical protein|nr:hypothetical protein [Burkholderiales bacterium]